ncbi:hypothetical protein J6590_016078 [Homalodisca vitripennis]|nr:hypothetical protein J6590_016078 [Homalodisca vitripennis]
MGHWCEDLIKQNKRIVYREISEDSTECKEIQAEFLRGLSVTAFVTAAVDRDMTAVAMLYRNRAWTALCTNNGPTAQQWTSVALLTRTPPRRGAPLRSKVKVTSDCLNKSVPVE